jgi:hypothetical protein
MLFLRLCFKKIGGRNIGKNSFGNCVLQTHFDAASRSLSEGTVWFQAPFPPVQATHFARSARLLLTATMKLQVSKALCLRAPESFKQNTTSQTSDLIVQKATPVTEFVNFWYRENKKECFIKPYVYVE